MSDKNVPSPVLRQLIHHGDREPALSAGQAWCLLEILSARKQQTRSLLNILVTLNVTSRPMRGGNLKHLCKGLKMEAKEKHRKCIICLHLRLDLFLYSHEICLLNNETIVSLSTLTQKQQTFYPSVAAWLSLQKSTTGTLWWLRLTSAAHEEGTRNAAFPPFPQCFYTRISGNCLSWKATSQDAAKRGENGT